MSSKALNNGNEETFAVEAVSLLPEELWDDILDRLPSFQDKLSIYRTCRLWKSLLEPKSTFWMFEMVFPPLFHYLPKFDMSECRLVCKSWCRAIDTYLEEGQPILKEIDHCYSRSRAMEVDFHKSAMRINLEIPEVITLFQQQFDLHPRGNPFLSRSVHLTITELSRSMLDFFDKFGSDIWYLHVIFPLNNTRIIETPPRALAAYLWHLLVVVPNLRKLKLSIYNIRFVPTYDRTLETFLATNPPPELPHLKCLDVAGLAIPKVRCAMEKAYGSQVTSLHHSGCQESSWSTLTNLTTLKVTLTSNGKLTRYLDDLETFKDCQLKELQISVTVRDINLVKLFEWIEVFSGSLERLSIDWTLCGYANFPENINLPHLKHLELRKMHLGDYSSFEFLSSFRSLRTLKIHFTNKCYNEILEMMGQPASSMRTKVIDMHQLFDKLEIGEGCRRTNHLYRSNVWSLVPNLERVTFSHPGASPEDPESRRTYTRHEMPSMFRPFKMGGY